MAQAAVVRLSKRRDVARSSRGRWWWIAAVVAIAVVVLSPIRGVLLSALGYRVYVVESGSMEPALGVGDAILVRNLDDADGESIEVGDIITFAVNGGAFGTVTHRVVEVVESSAGEQYLTKGDANRAADSSPVARERIVGEVVARFPWIGSASRFLSGLPFLLALGAGYGATLLAGGARGARLRKVPKGRHQPPKEGSRI
jgi:signal peptidase